MSEMEDINCLDISTSMKGELKITPKRKFLPSFSSISPISSATESAWTESNYSSIKTVCQNALNPSLSSFENEAKVDPSGSPPSAFRRTSLCQQFDPLHSTCPNLQIYPKSYPDALTEISEPSMFLDKSANADFSKMVTSKNVPIISSEDTLISFESPKKLPRPLLPKNLFVHDPKSYKKYSEEEFSQILNMQKLRLQNEFAKKYYNSQTVCTEKDQQLEREISRVRKLNKSYYSILLESHDILRNISTRNDEIVSETRSLEVENEKLKSDIKTTKEDCNNLETAFSDVHKRYEQCKGMIKSYKYNEECLTRNIDSVQASLEEKSKMYDLLHSRSQEVKDQAAKQIEAAKKSAETQVVVPEAQLKKAQMQIYSIEHDLQQARLNNEKLGNIYDDLMSKIGK